jgi:N-acetylglucosaminyldiphosphoundecaprenol N-acetyl-beta-D-mannosaminyltransferase
MTTGAPQSTNLTALDLSLRSVRIGGVPFVAATAAESVETMIHHVLDPNRPAVHTHFANAFTISLASRDSNLAGVLESGVNFPDGRPVSAASQLRRDAPHLRQVRGPEFFIAAMKSGVPLGVRHFLLGSTPQTLEQLTTRLVSTVPGIQIVGTYSPPFRPLTSHEQEEQDRMIADSGAHMIWVGLGTPKQDFESARLTAAIGVNTFAVGAAFDFAAGNLRTAPAWMSSLALEWVYRFMQEPRRLWRRYVFGNAKFALHVVRTWRHV